ncbi:DinB family protein [Amycolatopsis sp. NPDC059027]|uniref:DinB family protein n=1 Tax=Amycolatopsis sp. NPDC059027 TaxID=3346709 RepID=UPI00367184B5
MPENDNPKGPNTVTTTSSSPTLDAERTDLLALLATARSALINTTRGLGDEQAKATPTVSALCLGGLLKHVAAMEAQWLRFVVEGPGAMNYELPEGVTWADIAAGTAREIPQWMIDHQNGFRLLPGETLAGVIEHYEQVAARSAEVIAALPDLSVTHPMPDAPWHEPGTVWSVRRVLLHVIAETTQHTGHAEILRESIDGQKSS